MIKVLSLNLVLPTSLFESKGLSPNNCALLMVILNQLQCNSIFSFMSGIQCHRKVIELFWKKSMSELAFYNARVSKFPLLQSGPFEPLVMTVTERTCTVYFCGVEAIKACSVISENLRGCGGIAALLWSLFHTFINDASLKKRLWPSSLWVVW